MHRRLRDSSFRFSWGNKLGRIGNILVVGLIGFLIVDPVTGAMWKLPGNLHGNLPEKSTSFLLDGQEFQVVMLHDLPLEMRGRLVKVN